MSVSDNDVITIKTKLIDYHKKVTINVVKTKQTAVVYKALSRVTTCHRPITSFSGYKAMLLVGTQPQVAGNVAL